MSYKIDVWAFGCVLLEMMTGKRPYASIKNDFAISNVLFNGKTPLKLADEEVKQVFDTIKNQKHKLYLQDLI